jgi:hypothetical protein
LKKTDPGGALSLNYSRTNRFFKLFSGKPGKGPRPARENMLANLEKLHYYSGIRNQAFRLENR